MAEMAVVRIGCQDASHGGRAVKVESFTAHPAGGWAHRGPNRGRLDVLPYVALADDVPAAEGTPEHTAATLAGRTRRRYTLRCKLCGLEVRLRGDRLYPLLDWYAAHGVAYVELASLAAIVS